MQDIQLIVTLFISISIVIIWILKRDKNLTTLLWIAWTFIWIVMWLAWIDPDNIIDSVPNLLWWLWSAFITSIVWIIASIIISFTEKENDNKDQIYYLKEIKNSIENWNSQNNLLLNEIKSLNKNIWWEWDTSLLTQMQKLRTTFWDKNDELKKEISNNHKEFIKSFDNFAEKMAKANSEELIKSIQKVMEDFNSKINDQLWQSFKELTTGIDNLLIWQNEYKDNIIVSTNALNKSADSLEKSSKWFEVTVEQSEKFSWISENLWSEIKTLNDSLEILKNWINEFDWVAKNTKEMSDSMIKSIDSLTNNFVSKANVIVEKSEEHIKSIKTILEEQTTDLTTTHKDLLNTLKQNVEENNRRVSDQLENIWNELEKQVIKLDWELWTALNKSLESLWKELTSITNKFTNQLEDLHNILNQVK